MFNSREPSTRYIMRHRCSSHTRFASPSYAEIRRRASSSIASSATKWRRLHSFVATAGQVGPLTLNNSDVSGTVGCVALGQKTAAQDFEDRRKDKHIYGDESVLQRRPRGELQAVR